MENGTPATQPAPSVSADEYQRLVQRTQELESQQQQYEKFLTDLQPYAPIVTRMLEDPEVARVYDDSYNAFQAIRQSQKPALPPEWDPKTNPYLEKIEKVSKLADTWESRFAEQERIQAQKLNDMKVQESREYLEKLGEQFPVLKENNWAAAEAIVGRSTMHGVSLEQAARDLEHLYKPRNAEATPSLRPGTGATGVPGDSGGDGKAADLVERATQLIREQRLKAR